MLGPAADGRNGRPLLGGWGSDEESDLARALTRHAYLQGALLEEGAGIEPTNAFAPTVFETV